MNSEKGPKYIYGQEHKPYYYYYHFGGHWENKHWKNDNKTVWRIFLSPALPENVNKHCNGFSILIGCLHRRIIWFSLFIGSFQRVKYILARKMRHNARQSDNNKYSDHNNIKKYLFRSWYMSGGREESQQN